MIDFLAAAIRIATPLLFAAREGDLESATLLLARGANVNDTAAGGTSVLVIATHSGNGKVASFLLTKLVQSQLYGVDGHDPLTLATAVILIAAIAVVAGYAPGRRATKIHPMEALRCD